MLLAGLASTTCWKMCSNYVAPSKRTSLWANISLSCTVWHAACSNYVREALALGSPVPCPDQMMLHSCRRGAGRGCLRQTTARGSAAPAMLSVPPVPTLPSTFMQCQRRPYPLVRLMLPCPTSSYIASWTQVWINYMNRLENFQPGYRRHDLTGSAPCMYAP